MKRFVEIDHTADLAMRVFGLTTEELFRNAVDGLNELQHISNNTDKQGSGHKIILQQTDLDLLLVDFLNEILFLQQKTNSCCRVERLDLIEHSDVFACRAMLQLYSIRHNENTPRPVKSVTYGGVRIQYSDKYFIVDLIVDV